MTTPTPSMLAAIQSCTLLDDVFLEDRTTADLESHVAALSGKEAGLFVTSGTMGNQLALRSLLVQPPHAVLCDHRSHILVYEAGGFVTSSPARHAATMAYTEPQRLSPDRCHRQARCPQERHPLDARGCRRQRCPRRRHPLMPYARD